MPFSPALPYKLPIRAELGAQLLLLFLDPFHSLEHVAQASPCESVLKSFTTLRTEIAPLALERKDILAPATSLSVHSFRDIIQAREVLADGTLSDVQVFAKELSQ